MAGSDKPLEKWTVNELKAELKALGLSVAVSFPRCSGLFIFILEGQMFVLVLGTPRPVNLIMPAARGRLCAAGR